MRKTIREIAANSFDKALDNLKKFDNDIFTTAVRVEDLAAVMRFDSFEKLLNKLEKIGRPNLALIYPDKLCNKIEKIRGDVKNGTA